MISFNEYVIDVEKRALLRDGESVHLAKKPFDVLVYLIERPGELVTREELLREFWPGGHTYDEAVYSCISAIRKALCDLGNEPRFIETRWREGYRFIANPRPSHTNDKAAWDTTQGDEPASPSLLTATSQQRSTRSVFGLALFLMLGFLIAGALWQKSSGDRTGSASTSPATASVEKQISSVGVLPVQGADSDRWLRQGLAEELLHAVSSIEGMRVVKVLSEAPLDEEQLRRLDVDALLESTLLPESSAGSLYLRLLDSDDSSIVWSYHAEHSLDQLAESRTEIVASLANHLTASLRGFSLSTPATAEAWPPYLRARYQWNLRTPESIRNAIELYQQVIKLDPTYANAYAGLAEAYAVAPLWAGSNSKEAYAQVRNFAQRAIELEPNLARAHAALGFYYAHHGYDWEQAQYYFARALELDPNSVTAHQWKADAYCYRLLIEECAHHIAIAKSLDPLSPFIEVLQGVPLRFGKQFLAAEQHFRSVLARYPNSAAARFQLAVVLYAQGRFDEALEQYDRIYAVYGPKLIGSAMAWCYSQLGRHEDARDMISTVRQLEQEDFVSPTIMAGTALVYEGAEDALHWLGKARDEKDHLFSAIAVIHHFYYLYEHPTFQLFAEELGIPRERLLAYNERRPDFL